MRQDDNAPCVICSEITAMLRMAGSAAVTATSTGAKYAEQQYTPWGGTDCTGHKSTPHKKEGVLAFAPAPPPPIESAATSSPAAPAHP